VGARQCTNASASILQLFAGVQLSAMQRLYCAGPSPKPEPPVKHSASPPG